MVFFRQMNDCDLPTKRIISECFDINPSVDEGRRRIFFRRVRLHMIGQFILGAFDYTVLPTIMTKDHLYTWEAADSEILLDGAVMLQIIMDHINPSIRIGITHRKDLLRNCRLANYNNNVLTLTEKMDKIYQEILICGGTHDDYLKGVFDALASGKNKDFNTFVSTEKTKCEMSEDIQAHTLINDANTIYYNMYTKKTW